MGEDYINSIFNYPESESQCPEECEKESEDIILVLADGTVIAGI